MIALIAGPTKPPRFAQGLGLPYLAAVLEKAGFAAKICDLYPASPDTDDPVVLDERLADAIAREQPDIIGMTIHTPEFRPRVRLAKMLRERLPRTLLVAGGHHPSAEPIHLLRNSDFDVCVIGEGEYSLLEIARGVAVGRKERDADWLRDIRGIAFKQGNRIVRTQPRPSVAELDSLPLLAHRLLGLEHYAAHPNLGIRSTGIISYRGCPRRCAFCLNPQGRRLRMRNPALVVEEMAWVAKEFGVRGFNNYDNLFGLNRRHALAVCEEIIRRGLDVVWDSWTAGDLVDAELANKMKLAGCVRVGFGAENGDDQVLLNTQRGFTSAQHQAGIDALRTAGLPVEVYLMIGLPGESAASVRRTIEFAKRCKADGIALGAYRPYPGTAIWEHPERYAVRIVHGPDFEAYVETASLSRAAIFDSVREAEAELSHCVAKVGILRCDRYAWE
ncbi:MAG: B12-binding domain-containing radical SAM protein [bacterium]|nr:B12-binding domain-containing radical SAM protein [bacterium]